MMHRDLKSPNVLLSEEGVAKIADVGMVRSQVRGGAAAPASAGRAGAGKHQVGGFLVAPGVWGAPSRAGALVWGDGGPRRAGGASRAAALAPQPGRGTPPCVTHPRRPAPG